MRRLALASPLLVAAALVAQASPAFGQATDAPLIPSLDTRAWDPPTDPDGGLYFEPAQSPDTADWNVALWTHYAYRPVTLKDPATGDIANKIIAHDVGGDLVFNIGFFERVAIGLDLPFAYYLEGDNPTAQTIATLGGDYEVPRSAVGDLKLNLKGTIIKPTNEELGGFALAIHERLGLPTGNQQAYLGEGAVKSTTRLLAEYRYLAVSAHAAAGVTLRASQEEYGCGLTTGDCETKFGHELPWGLALVFRPQALGLDASGHAAWFVEAFGHVPLSPQAPFTKAALSAVQIGGGARVAFLNDISFIAAVDAALVQGIGTPPIRAHLTLAWAPRKHDMDGDGVRDEVDECPEDLKEDQDGFEDEDGCPDWDNDDDGVPDGEDQCGEEREDEDGFKDDDGCPDPDNDEDGIPDLEDACPDEKGPSHPDPKRRGCPDQDSDHDEVFGDADLCPDVGEDPDGFQDEDGCPDPDNDGDG
ncbi:MAG: hypothetical protein KC731_03285, partial [Myxococcales bacterium]|nr:hypothetical protein [Myxococcales bacterium]